MARRCAPAGCSADGGAADARRLRAVWLRAHRSISGLVGGELVQSRGRRHARARRRSVEAAAAVLQLEAGMSGWRRQRVARVRVCAILGHDAATRAAMPPDISSSNGAPAQRTAMRSHRGAPRGGAGKCARHAHWAGALSRASGNGNPSVSWDVCYTGCAPRLVPRGGCDFLSRGDGRLRAAGRLDGRQRALLLAPAATRVLASRRRWTCSAAHCVPGVATARATRKAYAERMLGALRVAGNAGRSWTCTRATGKRPRAGRCGGQRG